MKIAAKLAFAAALPCLALLGFAADGVRKSYSQRSEAQSVLAITSLGALIGSLVHELQKERGMSVSFVTSRGQTFADALPAQRGATDDKLNALLANPAKSSAFHKGFSDALAAARDGLAGTPALRKKVSAFGLSGVDAGAAYTKLIGSLLAALDLIEQVSVDGDVTRAALAFTAIARAKEFAGQERANGARAFIAGVTPDDLALLSGLDSRQAERLGIARQLSGPREREALERFEASAENAAVLPFRRAERESLATMTGPAIDAVAWFRASTARIDAMRGLESAFATALQERSEQVKAEAEWALLISALSAGILLLLTGALFALIGRNIVAALHAIAGEMRRLAAGDLSVAVSGANRSDEIGEMAGAVQFFKDNMLEVERLRGEKLEDDRKRQAERKEAMKCLADAFDQAVGGIVETVSSTSTELEAAASTLSRTAETTQALSATVASASEQASANVQSVASATNEMSSSVQEISRQVQESARIAFEAVKQAEKTDGRITELSQAASRIGDVVKLITAIAEQTNLLALNATIEAARAGEAGKGFAVVAQEVKALAAQTGKATGDISSQITGMQAATRDSVAAIKEIGGTINRIAEIASSIAAAIEEQGAATAEIARNVQQAAQGTTQVASNITEVNRGAGETGSASSQVLSSAQQLAGESNRLKLEVAKFLTTVRAA